MPSLPRNVASSMGTTTRSGRTLRPLVVFASLSVCTSSSIRASADTTLTVDLSAALGPVTHAASGSLYGVTETLPADVDGLIAPLHPNMFTNPAANVQQPVGDAIVVAGRVAATGARVTIRLADWLKGFYTFTTMSDWFDKIGQTVARRKAAGLTNIYAYEIWNEPNGTYASSNPLSFNEFWRQTFAKLRELEPDIKITGPSLSYYNETWLRDFLSFCKTNGCLPDIVGWHELGGGNLTGTLQAYRALEKQLGIGPLPISINEYSGAGRIDVEGQPGASAPLIAKFERFRVDTACISYWDVAHAGRLGSLLATNTEPNGGWWFYKWYGDMQGTMISTTPPTPSSATALDGFANLDTTEGSASVLFGGTSDGTVRLTVRGFGAASLFGNRVHTVVEHTPFVNRSTVVKATDTLSTADLSVTDDQIAVSITNVNAKDGYRLKLTPVAISSGGSSGAGGKGSIGGGKASGGSSTGTTATSAVSSGGTRAVGGTAATGGARATGGTIGLGGRATGGVSTGALSTTGGASGEVATTTSQPTGGNPATGGTVGFGGANVGGGAVAPSGGASVGNNGSTVTPFNAGGATNGSVTSVGDQHRGDAAGCSCRVAPQQTNNASRVALACLLLLVGAARKAGRRHSIARRRHG